MGSDKSNVHPFDRKFDYNDKSMVVASYIEHIMLVANIVNTVKVFFDISKI